MKNKQKRLILFLITLFCLSSNYTGFGIANAQFGGDLRQCIEDSGNKWQERQNAEKQRIEKEKAERKRQEEERKQKEAERNHQEEYEMNKITTIAIIVGVFFVLSIIFYALISNNKKSQQNINIYNERPKE